jgi:glycosyltransferase involved in cell wall biosynthesis
MNTNNFSATVLLSSEKPYIINGQFDKFETLLFLPPSKGRIAEGGLRKKGNFKHSYKYIVKNHYSSASCNSSFEASEGKNKSTAGVLYSGVKADDNTGYTESTGNKIDLDCKTVTGKWYICDTDGNPIKPAPVEIQEKIEGYIQSLQDNINCDVENTDKNEDALQRPITFLPLITVITVVFNGVKTLEETIKSVVNQTYPNVEYLIIDGGSTDGTLDIIKKYEDVIDYWVSEPDNGIYDAMNKGIILIFGTWVYFLNSGDLIFNSNVFKDILINISNDFDFIYGNVFIKPIHNKIYDGLFSTYKLITKNINHQAIFYKKKLFTQYGFYNTKYYPSADHEFNLKIFKNSKKKYIDHVIAIYNEQGYSSINIDYKFLNDLGFIVKTNLGLKFFILFKMRRFLVKLLTLLRINILIKKFIQFYRSYIK